MNELILFDDEHLLVVNKPSGVNTHKPDRYAPDGIYEWLQKTLRRGLVAPAGRGRNIAPTNDSLSILHRLDKDTSGVLLFGKTVRANQSLSRQFEAHRIEKRYLLLSATKPTRTRFSARSVDAVTEFEFVQPHGRFFLVGAQPVTGKTHQIRRHAAENGFPIVGDAKYGGEPAPRLMLHAHQLTFEHPANGEKLTLEASVPAAFEDMDVLVAAVEFRDLLFGSSDVSRPESVRRSGEEALVGGNGPGPVETNAFRLISGAADGFPDVVVDSYSGNLLVQWQSEPSTRRSAALCEALRKQVAPGAIYEQLVTKQSRTKPIRVWCGGGSVRRPDESEPVEIRGLTDAPLERFPIHENGLKFLINFGEGLATGLFLDQRENRRHLLTVKLAEKTVLNCFSYTCAFSVAAANAGALTTSVDLSRRYLEWGKANFQVNELDPGLHSFLTGDVFDWLKRFQKRGQTWDLVILDPPTFATTKKGRAFQAARDYEELESLAMGVVAKGGTLFCSTNQRTLAPDKFEASLDRAARKAGRVTASVDFETLPFDFRVAEGDRPYLKTFWVRLD